MHAKHDLAVWLGYNPLTMIWPTELWKSGWKENPNLDTMVLWCFSKSKLFLNEDWIYPLLMLNKFVPNLKMDATITKLGWTMCTVWCHFQNGLQQRLQNYVFAYNLCSNIHRDNILVSTPMFLRMRNPLVTLLNFYECWFTQNSIWLPLKPAETTFSLLWYIQAVWLHWWCMWFIYG